MYTLSKLLSGSDYFSCHFCSWQASGRQLRAFRTQIVSDFINALPLFFLSTLLIRNPPHFAGFISGSEKLAQEEVSLMMRLLTAFLKHFCRRD
jgi:hypothetical protein